MHQPFGDYAGTQVSQSVTRSARHGCAEKCENEMVVGSSGNGSQSSTAGGSDNLSAVLDRSPAKHQQAVRRCMCLRLSWI